MIDSIGRLEEVLGKGRILTNEPLYEHTIVKQGGPAAYYIETDTLDDLINIVTTARRLTIPVFLLGGGSYVSLPDKGIDGLVVKNNCRKFDKMSMRGTIRENHMGFSEVLVSAESGVIMNQLVRFTIEEGLEGLEYQLGLPGTLGGAIYTNAQYKDRHVKDFLYSIRILSIDGEVQVYTRELPYFLRPEETWEETEDIVLSAVFKLAPEDKKILWGRGEEALSYRTTNL